MKQGFLSSLAAALSAFGTLTIAAVANLAAVPSTPASSVQVAGIAVARRINEFGITKMKVGAGMLKTAQGLVQNVRAALRLSAGQATTQMAATSH